MLYSANLSLSRHRKHCHGLRFLTGRLQKAVPLIRYHYQIYHRLHVFADNFVIVLSLSLMNDNLFSVSPQQQQKQQLIFVQILLTSRLSSHLHCHWSALLSTEIYCNTMFYNAMHCCHAF